jgi:hypothetical protein
VHASDAHHILSICTNSSECHKDVSQEPGFRSTKLAFPNIGLKVGRSQLGKHLANVMFVLAGILRKNQNIVDIRGTKFIQIRKKHEINIPLKMLKLL